MKDFHWHQQGAVNLQTQRGDGSAEGDLILLCIVRTLLSASPAAKMKQYKQHRLSVIIIVRWREKEAGPHLHTAGAAGSIDLPHRLSWLHPPT